MKKNIELRLLAANNNARGDLFTRLTRDLFFAFGYDNLRLNVHKSGREIDVQGLHRRERRRLVAECKAQSGPIGGSDLNKLMGAIVREKVKLPDEEIVGYFVSLNGFTETALDQELDTGKEAIIPLDGSAVVEELQNCRAIVSRDSVAQKAAAVLVAHAVQADLSELQLLGHSIGYIWCAFFSVGKEEKYFVLIHADGTHLAEAVAHEIVTVDKVCKGHLHKLQYLKDLDSATSSETVRDKVIQQYKKWLGEEFGYIHLDGLPADTELTAMRLRLERLFVPMFVLEKSDADDGDVKRFSKPGTRIPLGAVMEDNRCIAVLATPGGGKTTILKRLATAYAFPERLAEIADQLPKKSLLPIILRCRELRDRAHHPILQLLVELATHVCVADKELKSFHEYVHEALQSGKALLLIDGLDEITEEGARYVFASNVRTFLAMFPQVSVVVTSRPAGFRQVAGVIASACVITELAPLDHDEVQLLCQKWHREVVGDSAKVELQALELATVIWKERRIRSLAENPLLLTTLLVVKRWIGEVPKNRAALYAEAVKVLIRTWNVEGYEPLDEDETLAQLSFVACMMMQEGIQQIGYAELINSLTIARQQLEAELQFASVSPQQFVQRIEYRSSVLMQVGHRQTAELLEPVYEFRHLTFQEFFAARGYVKEQYPNRNDGVALEHILRPHFNEERWREVVPLAAAQAGRKAENTVKYLIETLDANSEELEMKLDDDFAGNPVLYSLVQALLDEVQLTSATLRQAILSIANGRRGAGGNRQYIRGLASGKFRQPLYEVIEEAYFSGSEWEQYHTALSDCALATLINKDQTFSKITPTFDVDILGKISSSDLRIAAYPILKVMLSAYAIAIHGVKLKEDCADLAVLIRDALCEKLDTQDLRASLLVSWALAWIGEGRVVKASMKPKTILTLFQLWRDNKDAESGRFAAWALSSAPLLSESLCELDWGEFEPLLNDVVVIGDKSHSSTVVAALVVGWYVGRPWDPEQQLQKWRALLLEKRGYMELPVVAEGILGSLGAGGRELLREFREQRESRNASAKKA